MKDAKKVLEKLADLAITENELRLIFDQMPFLFWYKDERLRMVYCTRFYNEILLKPRGYDREKDYYGNTDYAVHSDDIAKAYQEHDREVLKDGRPITFKEKVMINSDTIEMHFIKYPKIINGKNFIAGIGIMPTQYVLKYHDLIN